ncbi:MAG: hypothetical protein PHC90_00650 [Syntrophorhabdaceae bacterium]|nr:hypothetical protein [Syntrophorhabdaceae bacterium]
MGDRNSLKAAPVYKCLDIILVVAGQAAVILPIKFEGLSGYFILAGIALGAAGLGIRAKRTDRGVISWVLVGLFFPIAIPVVALVFMAVRGTRHAPADAKPANIYIHAFIALAVFVVSAFLMDAFSFALICVFIAAIWVLSRRKGSYSRKMQWVLTGIYILALAMSAGMKAVNYRMSHANARIIIAACDAYKETKGEYPGELKDLVPDYLSEVPRARYTMSGGFHYHRNPGPSRQSYRLIFVNEAPFARMVYDSATRDWHGID